MPDPTPQDRESPARLDQDVLSQLFKTNPLPTWVHDRETLRFLDANPAMLEQYGLESLELGRVTVDELGWEGDPTSSAAEGLERDGPRMATVWHNAVDGRRFMVRTTARHVQVDGRPAELVVAEPLIPTEPHRNSDAAGSREGEPGAEGGEGVSNRTPAHGTFQDITDERRARAQLHFQSQLLEWIDQPVVASDSSDRVTYWNQAAEALFGWKSDEVLGTPMLEEMVHPEDREPFWRGKERADRGRPWAGELRLLKRDGGEVFSWISIAPARTPDGSTGGRITTALDITGRKEMEALEEELRHAQKMEALGRLCGGVAHDFNNRLTVIEGASETLLQELPPASDHRGPVQEILRESEHLAALTQQLLAYSRRQVLEERTLDASEVLSEMEPMLLRLVPASVELEVSRAEASCLVRFDRTQLEQVVMNLVVNAADALDGKGRITLRAEPARLSQAHRECFQEGVQPGTYACLTVADTGVGIEPDLLDRIFEPFFTTKPQGKGTGLGLSTVYGAVSQSGGRILVDSTPGEGAIFRIFLPEAEGPADGDSSWKAQGWAPAPVEGTASVLLVEDEAAVRKVARRALQRHGFRVVEAESGVHALQRLEEESLEPDVLVSDVVMPEMSGPELVARLLREGSSPVVVLTSGYSGTELTEEARRAATIFLEKPFTPNALSQAVHDALAGGPTRSTPTTPSRG